MFPRRMGNEHEGRSGLAVARRLAVVAACATLVASGSVLARSGGGYHGGGGWHGGGGHWHGGGGHWHGSVGVYVGPYWGWPYYWGWGWGWPYDAYPYPYGYSGPYPAYAASSPAMWVETRPSTPQIDYWYYCTDPAGYYPYVETCANPWRAVRPEDVAAPTPPGQAPADAGGK